MPTYYYEATDRAGKVFYSTIDAVSKDEALLALNRKDLLPISIKEGTGKSKFGLSFSIFESVTPEDRIALVRNLSITLRAGLNVIEAVDIIRADTEKKALRDILEAAKTALQKGQPLSSVFIQYPKYFSPVFTGLLQAGEVSGRLDASFEQLADQMSKEFRLRRNVKSALTYPVVLLVASFLVMTLLLVFVLPRLAYSFRLSGVQLPLLTRIVLALSDAISSHLVLFSSFVVGLFLLINFGRKTRSGHRFLLQVAFKIPVVNKLIKKIALVRFSRNLSSLIGSGINIIEAITIASDTVGNVLYREKILVSIGKIKNGISLSDALKDETQYFPHLLVNMIAVGERTGTLEFVLKTFADYYVEEVDNALKDLTVFLEPVMLLGMGLIIGVIALSILLPIYQLIGKFN